MSAPITIVLAEDQNLVRYGIRCLLEKERDCKVVGEAEDGLKVVDLVARLKPRILIVVSGCRGSTASRSPARCTSSRRRRP